MVELTSPQGTMSTLLPYREKDSVIDEGYTNWPFMSVHHWGEDPTGTWTLKVTFNSNSGNVEVKNMTLSLYGTATTPSSVSGIPSSCDSACAGKCSGPGQENCDACKNFRIAETLECVDRCPNNTCQYKKYCLGGQQNYTSNCPKQPPPPPQNCPKPNSQSKGIIGIIVAIVVVTLLVVCAILGVRIGYYEYRSHKRRYTTIV